MVFVPLNPTPGNHRPTGLTCEPHMGHLYGCFLYVRLLPTILAINTSAPKIIKHLPTMSALAFPARHPSARSPTATIARKFHSFCPFISFLLHNFRFIDFIILENYEQFNHRKRGIKTMYYTQEQIDRANQADLVLFLQSQGEPLILCKSF